MKKTLQVVNGIAFVSVLVVNYLSNTGQFNNTTIGEVSAGMNNLFTPAGYAFSIWGLIYFLLLGFVIYQGRSLFVKVSKDEFIMDVGWWFAISCLANISWIFAWIYQYTLLSCVFILFLLFSLIMIVKRCKMELWDAPFPVILFLWWPFVIYSGWVTVASIANISAYFEKINWNGFGFSDVFWTALMVMIAVAINLIITWRRNMREFAVVGAWALVAIAVANYGREALVVYISGFGAALLLISSTIHAYQNRHTNPFKNARKY